jgi:methanogenic corrinoid protein MtbC1
MKIIGDRFSAGTYFIPDLIFSGKILEQISGIVKPKLSQKASEMRLGKIVIGSVAGDLHDIGKKRVLALFGPQERINKVFWFQRFFS